MHSNAIGGSVKDAVKEVAFTAKAGIVIEQVATFPDNGWKIQEVIIVCSRESSRVHSLIPPPSVTILTDDISR